MSKSKLLAWICGSLILLAALAWSISSARGAPLPVLLGLMWLSSLAAVPLYLYRDGRWGRSAWIVAGLIAVLARGALWTSTPGLSDDIYRYVWDGRTQAAGVNPYRFAPSDPRLDLPRDADYAEINHKHIPTIYPPLAQLVFLLLTLTGGTIAVFKAGFIGMDLALGVLLWRRVSAEDPQGARAALLLYLWHPLILYEFAGSGHVDVLWVLCFIGAILAIERKRFGWAMCAFAAAISAKLIALAFLPLFWKHAGGRRAVGVLALVAVSYLPYAGAGFSLWAGLQAYSLWWRFNDFAFWMLSLLPGSALTARLIAPLLGLGLAVWIARSGRDIWRGAMATALVVAALLPVNYPWYWALLPALLVVRPLLPVYLFSLSLLLTYEVLPRYYAQQLWELATWVRLLEAALLAWGLGSLGLAIRREGQMSREASQ